MDNFSVIKIFILTTLSFIIAMSWTPALTYFLFKYKLGKQIRDEKSAPIMSSLHKAKSGTPTMGGVLIWVTVLFLALTVFYLGEWTGWEFLKNFNFLTRSQTLLPLGALVASAVVGLIDDYLNARKIGPNGGGFRMRHRLLMYTLIAAVGAWWFYFKLDWHTIHVPFLGNFDIGWWYLPILFLLLLQHLFQ